MTGSEKGKWTPGKWRTYELDGRQVIATKSPWAYSAVGYIPEDDKGTEIANARLIAAAPEMAEALREALPLLSHLANCGNSTSEELHDDIAALLSSLSGEAGK